MNRKKYPKLIVDLKKLRHNIDHIYRMCRNRDIELAGVIKGCSGLPECAMEFAQAGCRFIASSRLEQLQEARNNGVPADFMMIRIPALSEAADVVRLADISLNSELETLAALNVQAGLQDKIHKVILMVELGDLREGFWNREELLEAALKVENEFYNLELAGVGTNLGCYGAIEATPEKLQELVECAEIIEFAIGRELEFISGGATTSLPRLFEDNMPERINLLRVGEGILLAKDLEDLWGYDLSRMHRDVFTLRAEIVELRDKPTYPIGEIRFDAYGNQPDFEDQGIRRRAIVALGKVDYAFPELLECRDERVKVLGASSDHTILDIEEAKEDYRLGDVLEFNLCYATLLYVTNSRSMDIVFV